VITSQTFAQAIQQHRAGHLADAEALYRQVLAAEPRHAEALHHLGILALQAGRHALAIDLISQALVLDPDNATAYSHLGESLRCQGRFQEAIATFQQAAKVQPDNPGTYNNLGNALRDDGQFPEAAAAFRQALALDSSLAEVHNNLGNVLQDLGLFDEAASAYQRCLDLTPDVPEALNNLGSALAAVGKFPDAETAYRRAITLQPTLAAAHSGLGAALAAHGQVPEALAALQRALQLQPQNPAIYNNLGAALKAGDRIEDALAAFRQAITLRPDYPEAYYNLGNALRQGAQLDHAVAAYREALRLRPTYPEASNNLGNALKDQAQLDEAITAYRLAFLWKPTFLEARSNLIYTLLFDPRQEPRILTEEQAQWNHHADSLPPQRHAVVLPQGVPEGRLRVGYVSPEFREHVTGRYLTPLFREHDRKDFEIICYAGVQRPDSLTEVFHQYADLWRDTGQMSDEDLAQQIQKDRIDILVDLTQHLSGNRLPVFARRPVAVQVSFAGYPATTGLSAIPYRISDRYVEAEAEDRISKINPELRALNSELPPAEQVYLLDSFWSYDPCGLEVPINESPAFQSGVITFGCFNNFCKVNEPFLQLCARTLREIGNSRIIFLAAVGSHRDWVRKVLQQEGIDGSRVEFVEPQPRHAYLELYHRLDVVLDPFPYNGHTTSLDALWMGVPIVSLVGTSSVSRGGFSILNNLGLPELAAFSPDDYVAIAARLARDPHYLSELRATLRSRMQSSTLMDAPHFARGIESAYRAIWQQRSAAAPAEKT
jgi:predicted O-linked N-acetylglucosamine transferase (SPINDLY family)